MPRPALVSDSLFGSPKRVHSSHVQPNFAVSKDFKTTMKRARSASSVAKSSSDPASSHSGEAQTSPKNSSNAASAAILSGQGSNGNNFLVAFAGIRALGAHIQDASRGKRLKERVMSWEDRAGLGLPRAKLALGFLDVLGVSLILLIAL